MINFNVNDDKTKIKSDYDFELYQEIKKVTDAFYSIQDDEWEIDTVYLKHLIKQLDRMNVDVSAAVKELRGITKHKKYQHEEIEEEIKTIRIQVIKENPKSLQLVFDYDPEVLKFIKQTEGRTWIDKSKAWRISKDSIDWLYFKLDSLKYVDLSQLESFTTIHNNEIKITPEDFPYSSITPYNYQIDTANKLVTYKKVINALEAGLGKTPITVMACEYINKPTLIICPATIKYNWEKEIYKIDPYADVVVLDNKDIWQDAQYVILNYDIIETFIEDIRNADFKIVVYDEAHKLRGVNGKGDPTSQRARYGLEIAKKMEYVFPITATPFVNQTKDIFNLLRVIEHPHTKNWYGFANRYCGAEKSSFGTSFNGSSNQDELNSILYPNYMIRIRTEDHIDLPERVRSFIPLKINMSKYEKAVEKYMNNRNSIERNGQHLVYLTAMRKELATAKAKHCIQMAKDLLEQNKSVVLFTNYTDVVDSLYKCFEKNAVKVTGDVSAKDRQKAVDLFQSGEKKVFIGNIDAAGEGITLTRSHQMIVVDFHWSPVVMVNQMEKRINRITQDSTCYIQYLYVPEAAIEKVQLEMLEEKLNDATLIIDGKKEDFFINKLIDSIN